MNLFKPVEEIDVLAFKQWARDNYSPGEEISGVWHPIVQSECVKINEEKLGCKKTYTLKEIRSFSKDADLNGPFVIYKKLKNGRYKKTS